MSARDDDPYQLLDTVEFEAANRQDLFFLREPRGEGGGIICRTEPVGHATPRGLDLTEIRVDASEGFIPLWAPEVTLRWRFQKRSLRQFRNPVAAAAATRRLFAQAVTLWGDAVPIRFSEQQDAWDFEIVFVAQDDCEGGGCVLASAFFPDGGQHELSIYPMMFRQPLNEQVETLAHEIGHVFGLRHFFANISETRWKSELFGTDTPFSIMNYGNDSKMGDADRRDLKTLYQLVWGGKLTEINGTRFKLVRPFSANRPV